MTHTAKLYYTGLLLASRNPFSTTRRGEATFIAMYPHLATPFAKLEVRGSARVSIESDEEISVGRTFAPFGA